MTSLVKAKLIAQGGGDDIEFMFNPTELDFSRSMNLNRSDGARTDEGLPKVTFGSPEPYKLSLSNLTFDTYETGKNVYTEYISKFQQAVEFLDDKERPPIYLFTWGSQEYLRCFVQSLSYKLTLFLADGTPVRAVVNLSLEEIGETTSNGNTSTPSGNRSSSSRW
ncbi:MAG: CIS tube protein [Thainema sp.]